MKRFTLADLILAVVLFSALAAAIIPSAAAWQRERRRRERAARCGSNLSALTKAMYMYSITKANPGGAFPAAPLGGAWWALLYESGDIDDHKLLWCPIWGSNTAIGGCDYWGPAVDPNMLDYDDAIGCCGVGHHADGPYVWVAKGGDIHRTSADAPEWATIRRTVKP